MLTKKAHQLPLISIYFGARWAIGLFSGFMELRSMKSVTQIAAVMLLLTGISSATYAADAPVPIENWQEIKAGLLNGEQTSEGYGGASQVYSATSGGGNAATVNNNLVGPTSGSEVSAVPELDGSSAAIAFGLLIAVGLIIRERKRANA